MNRNRREFKSSIKRAILSSGLTTQDADILRQRYFTDAEFNNRVNLICDAATDDLLESVRLISDEFQNELAAARHRKF